MGGNRGRASYLGHARGGVARCKTGPETVFETVPETAFKTVPETGGRIGRRIAA